MAVFTLILLAGMAVLLFWEGRRPARRFPEIRGWRLRGALSVVAYFALAGSAPYLWADWLGTIKLIDASGLPLWLSVPLGFAAVQLVAYWWHRTMHASDTLWRLFHQMHHSAERLDIWGSFYLHPFDTLGFTFWGSFALTVLCNVQPLAAGVVGVIGGLAAVFTHTNVATPAWIGWLFQRPEGHGRHHERGRHAGNYAELVLWDRLFGTYENPSVWQGQAGFYDGASGRVWDMLTFRDVSTPKRHRLRVDRHVPSWSQDLGAVLVVAAYATVYLAVALGIGSAVRMIA